MVEEDVIDSVMMMMDNLEEWEEPLEYEDTEGLAHVYLVSATESEGHNPVCIQYLYPRAFDFVQLLGFERTEPKDGELSSRF